MKTVFQTERYGNLYMDRILFETYIPILFVCKNEIGDLFICVCCQDNKEGKKVLIARTDGASIVRLLKNEVAIRDIFVDSKSPRLSITSDGKKSNQEYEGKDWAEDSPSLPKRGAYLDPEEDEYAEEIRHYSSYRSIRYDSLYSYDALDSIDDTPDFRLPVEDRTESRHETPTAEISKTLKDEEIGFFTIEYSAPGNNYQTVKNEEVTLANEENVISVSPSEYRARLIAA